MKFKSTLVVFLALILANIFADNTMSFNLYDTYYVFNGMQLIVALTTVFVGFLLVKKIIVKPRG
ncbi:MULTISPECIES: hypothetical protein [Cellulophaga]|uniref:Uncharacterized protein n=2 Tax=Cellulophaga TaxID=104264 RepID=F0RA85_CELLC|nr:MULTISPECIES: hypothetical protein [Cellulophaga]ADY29429.1 hypothetical protein Celly_1605 [Cellulophaga lytica DSM 7489]AIM60441.1 hypothetical protein IX49_07845 [Cellulophaga lytica]APU10316.1 hypothetical protein A5M85_08465 [Cellulophaga lytica]EWH13805.1 hypothetical protein KLA_07132 [Cellulophaga geojensis KL-A]WQG76398.1 hypothetical protein SR888_11965 [Cellulophaga lytica]